MAILELERIDFIIYDKRDKSIIPARFYVNKYNKINILHVKLILKGLLRTLSNKYGSISVQDIKLDNVLNPATNKSVIVQIWSQSKNEKINIPLKKIISFKTGFNRETNEIEGEQNIIIKTECLIFKGVSSNKKDYRIKIKVFKDWKNKKEPGRVKNSYILKKIREAINNSKNGVSLNAEIKKSSKNNLYINDIKV